MTKKNTPTPTTHTRRQSEEAHPYVPPKTAAELGITCLSEIDGQACGRAVIWFDYELGEREFYKGFVCDDHRISTRVEKLAV
jgi:hypothetical protein